MNSPIPPMSNSVSDLPTDSPSPPPLSQDNKLPSFKLACSVKRSLSPDDDRSPFLPMMNHSSKRLAGGPKTSSQPTTSLTKHYDGLGGRSRLDMFPKPKTTFSFSQQSSKVKPHKAMVVGKQTKTIDKFFGSFDTP